MVKKTETSKNIVVNRTISDFLNHEYRDYSLYVISNRACPSLVDGFKTGARKIMHASFTGSLKNGATKKVTTLAGETMALSLYQHGDSSLNGTIITLSQDFNFNLNPLYVDGQNGSLRSQDAASPRYLYVRHSKYSDIWKEDKELLEYEEEEGQQVEPTYYLPIIPVILCQRQSGMAPGYAFSCMSYNPTDVIDACILVLNGNSDGLSSFVLHPYIRQIKKKNWKIEEGKWVNYGVFKWDPKKKEIQVTDLPYDITFDNFEKTLNKMVEKEDIREWKNLSSGDLIDYRIDCKKGKWSSIVSKSRTMQSANEKIEAKLKMKKVVPDDLLWVVDENKKIKHFNNAKELIEYFVNFRLQKYSLRKTLLLKELEKTLRENEQLILFINLVCKGKLKIRNRSKVDIKKDMDLYKLPIDLIKIPMSRVTIEERDELLKENEEIKKHIDYVKNTTERQMYINDLNDLRKQLDKDFK